jgi:beta-lactamase regulating signal transducer with metallopeptidase domain
MLYAAAVALLVSAAAWALERGTRSQAVPARWIWAAAIACSCLLPLAALAPPGPSSEPVVSGTSSVGEPGVIRAADAAARPAPPTPRSRASSSFAALRSWLPAPPRLPDALDPLAIGLWALLSLGLGGAVVRAHLTLRRARRSWTRDIVDGRDVFVSREVGPAVVGVLRPAIVMPRWAAEMPPGDRELILRHEEEHHRAGDAPLLAVALLSLVLLPWNLPLWWQIRRLRLAVEVDCDRRVIRRSAELRRYALLLVEMSRRGSLSRLGALALAHPAPFLERRIRTMTERQTPRHLRTMGSILLAGVLVAAAGDIEPPLEVAPVPASGAELLVEIQALNEAVAGRVSERSTGAPVEGARIEIAELGLGATSRANGVFVLVRVPPGPHAVDVTHPELGAERVEVQVRERAERAPAPRAPAPQARSDGRITGRVTDAASGAPLADVQVYLVDASIGAITRVSGAYVILNVPAGTYQLRAERIGLSTVTREVTVVDGGVLEVNFEMTPVAVGLDEIVVSGGVRAPRSSAPQPAETARISGRVTDAETGAPLADVQVYLAGASIGAITRQNGVYLIINVPPGTYEMRAERIGRETVYREITVVAGQVLEENFQTRPRPMSVRILTPPGGDVRLLPRGAEVALDWRMELGAGASAGRPARAAAPTPQGAWAASVERGPAR